MRGPIRFAAVSFMLCSIARLSAAQSAQSVLLVRPSVDDPTLIDAFHRVEAELRIHHFDPQLSEPARGVSLEALATRAQTLAAIQLVRRAGQTTLDLWLRDRATGATSLRTLEAGQGADAASLIAVRAVDLLRARGGEFDPDEPAPAETESKPIAPAPPPAASPPSAASSEPTSADTDADREPARASIELEACALRPGSDFGIGVGAALGWYYRPIDRLALGVTIGLPLTAATVDTSSGSARVHQALAAAEARWFLLQTRSFRLAPLVGLGAYALEARGHPLAPLIGRSGALASFLIEAGARAELALFRQFAIGATLRALALLPRTGVAVDNHKALIDLPAFEATLGISIGY